MKYKGIIMAGGVGSRLSPLTKGVSKQLLPIYDKPMIYYSLSVLMLAGIQEILIVTTEEDQSNYKRLLGNGDRLGIRLEYVIQPIARGLADAFLLGEKFIGGSPVALILGDNLFYGQGFSISLEKAISSRDGATIFGYQVKDPERFGVVGFDENHKAISIEEKPKYPKSSYAVTGLYFYDNNVVEIAKNVLPSERGELEITSINQEYLKRGQLRVEVLGRGFTWLDAGTHESLLEAGQFVSTIQRYQGLKVACLEEISFANGWISEGQLDLLANEMKNNDYGQYLRSVSTRGAKIR